MNAVPQPVAPAIDLTDISVFGHLTSEALRFSDVDANGHINNVAYLVLFAEDVRRQLLGIAGSPAGLAA